MFDLEKLLEKMDKANASYVRIELPECDVFVVTDKFGSEEMARAWDEYASEN